MKSDAGVSCVYDVHFKNVPLRAQRSAQEYSAFFRELVPEASTLCDEHPKVLDLSNPAHVNQELQGTLSNASALTISAVMFNMLGASFHDFDDLATALYTTLASQDVKPPVWVVFVISPNDEQDLRRSVMLAHLIEHILNVKQINLLVQFSSAGFAPFVMTESTWVGEKALPVLPPYEAVAPLSPHSEPIAISYEQILSNARVIFGHFDITNAKQKAPYHLPAIVSWEKLANDLRFVSQLVAEMEAVAGSSFHLIHAPLVEGNGSEIIAAAILARRSNDDQKMSDGKYVILTDLLFTAEQLDFVAEEIRNEGGLVVAMFCLARYKGIMPAQVEFVKSYVDLPYKPFSVPDQCPFCDMDSRAVPVTSLSEITKNLHVFDPVTFWELIGSSPKFYSVGHEAMKRTGYHYHFRLLIRELLQFHAYGIAIRLRNMLRKAQVYPEWIRTIVCPDDDELHSFAGILAEVFNLRQEDVVFIPREHLRSVAGRALDPSTARRMPAHIGDSVSGRNVLIVDQAAHHFRTVSALASICRDYGGIVMAFAVIIDRVDPAVRLTEHSPSSHYIHLYSWPCRPSRPSECPCED